MRKEKKLEIVNEILDSLRCMREEIKEDKDIGIYISNLKYKLRLLQDME